MMLEERCQLLFSYGTQTRGYTATVSYAVSPPFWNCWGPPSFLSISLRISSVVMPSLELLRVETQLNQTMIPLPVAPRNPG